MNAPPPRQPSLAVIEEQIREHSEKAYKPDGEGGMICKECGLVIQNAVLYVSIHYREFDDQCAGNGKVKTVYLPFCLKCEGRPTNTSTCIHI